MSTTKIDTPPRDRWGMTPRMLIALSMALCGVGCASPPTDTPRGALCAPDPSQACDVARGAGLLSCVERAAHPRAGCMKTVQEAYGACIAAAGMPDQGRIETCIGECVFQHVTCLDQRPDAPCDEWRSTCEAECL